MKQVSLSIVYFILSAISLLAQSKKVPSPFNSFISIQMDGANETDTFTLKIYDEIPVITKLEFCHATIIRKGMDKDGRFNFLIENIKRPKYIFLSKDSTNKLPSLIPIPPSASYNHGVYPINIMNFFLVEPYDNVKIDIRKDSNYVKSMNKISEKGFLNSMRFLRYYPYSLLSIYYYPFYSIYFSGNGAAKYECKYVADRICSADSTDTKILNRNTEYLESNFYMHAEAISLATLEKYKNKMSPTAYNILKADFIGIYETEAFFELRLQSSNLVKDSVLRQKTLIRAAQMISSNVSISKIPLKDKATSISFPFMLVSKKLLNINFGGKINESQLKDSYYSFTKEYHGQLLDKILSAFILHFSQFVVDRSELINYALNKVKNKGLLDLINTVAEAEMKGQIAYNFSLIDTTGKIIRLSDFKGKVVFVDFWYTGCTGCKQYYTDILSIVEKKFKGNSEVVFVTINIDKDPNTWKNGIHKGGYTSPEVINLNTNGKFIFDPVIRHYQVLSYPRPLLIDRNGKIFSSSEVELRNNGIEGVVNKINEALSVPPSGH